MRPQHADLLEDKKEDFKNYKEFLLKNFISNLTLTLNQIKNFNYNY